MRLPILFLIFCGVLSFKANAQEPNKIALIVAISKYPAISGWGELSSSNDVKLIKDALMRQGFKEQNITVLSDKQATAAGIANAIDKDLIQKVKPGDIAVFHFSGHGQQIQDDDANHDEADGLDESLVPFDATVKYRPGPDNHFRDDALGKKLAELRQKLGPTGNALIVIDACHSGTMTRGIGRKRGTTEIYAAPGFKTKTGTIRTITDDAYNILNQTKGVAPMACFFASSPEESNQEAVLPDGTGAGSLSLAFSRALANADKNTTYRGLFDNIKVEMSSLVSRQTPLAEGDLDFVIFGGKAVGKPSYYQIKKDDQALTIPVGKIYGVFSNTTLKLYKADTRDTSGTKPIATGIITTASEYSSDIKLNKTLTDAELKTAWVYLDEINYGDLGVKVKLNVADAGFKNNLTGAFSKIKQASLVDNAADLFLQSGMNQYSADSLYLVNAGETIVWQTSKNNDKQKLHDTLAMKVGDYARAKYLRSLALTNPTYKVTVAFIPLKCVSGCDNPRTAKYQDDNIKTKTDASGNIFFRDGDHFRLNITNHSDQKILYYTVLDIQPDNQVNVLIPGRRDQPEEFRILQEQTVKLEKIFTIGPPFGVDVLKVIASDTPLDLREIFENRGAGGTRGAPKSPFAKIVEGTFQAEGNKTRGSKEDTIQPDAVNIMTVPFHITEKK